MKNVFCIAFVTCFASIVLAYTSTKGGHPSPFGVPSEILDALRDAAPTYRHFDHPADHPRSAVPAERIPSEARNEAVDWIRRVVRSSWLPDNVRDMLKGQRRWLESIPPHWVDCFVGDYSLGGGRFSILENGASVAILWHNPNIQVGPDPSKSALFVAQSLLHIPEERVCEIEPRLKSHGDSKLNLLVGVLRIPMRNKEDYPSWYNSMFVWMAPEFFYIAVPEMEGIPPANPQAQPGIPPRFLRTEAEQ